MRVPPPGALCGENVHPGVLGGGAAGEINLDGLVHLAGAEGRPGGSRAQHDLVDVVVQDDPEVLEVVLAQPHAHVLGDAVADRARMPDALALDDLHLGMAGGGAFGAAHERLHFRLLPGARTGAGLELPADVCVLELLEALIPLADREQHRGGLQDHH